MTGLLDVVKPRVSKKSVNYSRGMGRTKCKYCVHFLVGRRCEIVEGRIDPEYWCRRFSARR